MSLLAMNDYLLKWVVVMSGVMIIVIFCVDIYVKYFVLEKAEEQLKNCEIVIDAKKFWGNSGFIGRRYRLVAVNLALTSTKLLLSKGLVDIDEVNRVPIALRRWVCIPDNVSIISLIIGMGALALLGELW